MIARGAARAAFPKERTVMLDEGLTTHNRWSKQQEEG